MNRLSRALPILLSAFQLFRFSAFAAENPTVTYDRTTRETSPTNRNANVSNLTARAVVILSGLPGSGTVVAIDDTTGALSKTNVSGGGGDTLWTNIPPGIQPITLTNSFRVGPSLTNFFKVYQYEEANDWALQALFDSPSYTTRNEILANPEEGITIKSGNLAGSQFSSISIFDSATEIRTSGEINFLSDDGFGFFDRVSELLKVQVHTDGSIFSSSLTPSTLLQANASTNISSIANPSVASVVTNSSSGPGNFALTNFARASQLVWTNDGTFIWPAGSGTANSGIGPPFQIRKDGSHFYGTNVAVDVGDLETRAIYTPLYAVSFVESNQPTAMDMWLQAISNEDYTYYGSIGLDVFANKDTPNTDLSMTSKATNGVVAEWRISTDPGGVLSRMRLRIGGEDYVNLQPQVADGSSAIAFRLRSHTTLADAEARLLTVENSNAVHFGITSAGKIWSSSLTPSTLIVADSLTNLASIANAAGVPTNSGSGITGYLGLGSLAPASGGAYIATNTGRGFGTTTVGTHTNTGTIGQVAPLHLWQNSNSTQTASMQSNAVLVLRSNVVAMLFGEGASAANVGLKNELGTLQVRQGADGAYAQFSAATLNSWSGGIINRTGVGSTIGFNGQWLFGNPAQGVAEIFNDTGTLAMTNRIWGSRTNSTTGWWLESGYSENFGWNFLRGRSSHLLQPLAVGIGTNWAFQVITNGFDAHGGVLSLNAGSLVFSNATADRVALWNGDKRLTNSANVDATELGYLDGVTSALQTQLDGKQLGNAKLTNAVATGIMTNYTVTTITNTGVSLYTVPSGVRWINVKCVGGGAGGGGVDGATSQSAAAGGGGSGGYAETNILGSLAASYIVTIGTNGLGGAAGNNNGSVGGSTLFTNILTAGGGLGGIGDASAAGVGYALGGAGAAQTASGNIYSGGSPGGNGICISSALAASGAGASCGHWGGGGAPQEAAVGANATGHGAGGSGAAVITNTDRAGGNGSPGIIVITEFY